MKSSAKSIYAIESLFRLFACRFFLHFGRESGARFFLALVDFGGGLGSAAGGPWSAPRDPIPRTRRPFFENTKSCAGVTNLGESDVCKRLMVRAVCKAVKFKFSVFFRGHMSKLEASIFYCSLKKKASRDLNAQTRRPFFETMTHLVQSTKISDVG